MSIAILLVTHQGIGTSLRATALQVLGGELPAPLAVLDVPGDAEIEEWHARMRERLASLDGKEGTLVMTDIYGSTPANLAVSLGDMPDVRIITGLNLPMLIRALNYAGLPLDAVTDKALEGGLRSIFLTNPRSGGSSPRD